MDWADEEAEELTASGALDELKARHIAAALRAAHAAGRAACVSLLTASWDALATLATRDERSEAVQALMDRLHQAIIEA